MSFRAKSFNRSENAPSDHLAFDPCKPNFDLIEPGRVGGREVQAYLSDAAPRGTAPAETAAENTGTDTQAEESTEGTGSESESSEAKEASGEERASPEE